MNKEMTMMINNDSKTNLAAALARTRASVADAMAVHTGKADAKRGTAVVVCRSPRAHNEILEGWLTTSPRVAVWTRWADHVLIAVPKGMSASEVAHDLALTLEEAGVESNEFVIHATDDAKDELDAGKLSIPARSLVRRVLRLAA